MYWLLNGEPTIIDETNANWRNIYKTLSNTTFDGADPVEEKPVYEDAESIIDEPVVEENTELAELQAKYVEVYGKQLSPAYKNNVERIQKKLEEATLVPNE